VNVKFLPIHAGLRTGALLLNDSAGNVLSTVNLQGVGFELAFALDPGIPNALPISGLKDPSAVALDGLGNIFVVDKGNNRVIKLATNGTQTILGSGLISPTGAAEDGAGNVYVSDTGNDRVVKISPSGQQTTVLTGLNTPDGVAVDGAGNFFVADSGNNRVVKLSVDGVTQSTVGTGYSRPTGVAVDALGNVFVADFGNSQIVKVTAAGVQTTVIGSLAGPAGVSIDIAGNLYIPEVGANDVIMIEPFFFNRQTTVVGSGLNFPFDAVLVAVNTGGNVFVADTLNNRVLQVDRSNANLNFGTVTVGQTSASQTVIFSRIVPLVDTCCGAGRSPAPVFSDSTDFKQNLSPTDHCGKEYGDDQCNVIVTFTPQTTGAKSGTATINTSEMQVPAVIHLSGTGQ
jgi:streptogramin lyase